MTGKMKPAACIEVLEARIAPAAVFPTIKDAEANPGNHFISAVAGTPILLKAGDVLTTGNSARSGSYLMFVEKGQALVFTTDFNNNKIVDFNEITGIAAGDGLRLISFVDIHGDIVTNLKPDTTLSDSDNNASNNPASLKGDGRVLLNSRIEKIELRSITVNDLTDQNNDGSVNFGDVALRLVLTSYSIHGQVLAGGGFGVPGDTTSGLIINDAGLTDLEFEFGSIAGFDYYTSVDTPAKATIGGIRVGTAASGEYFSFGVSSGDDPQGTIRTFTPAIGQAGASIYGVKGATTKVKFNIGSLVAGDGGLRGPGGNIQEVTLNSDTSGGYNIIAGNGGRGTSGGVGGSIINFQDLGSYTGEMVIRSGTGGDGTSGAGGNAGNIGLGTMSIQGGLSITLGSGADGVTSGGNGASLLTGVFTDTGNLNPEYGRNVVGTTHDWKHNPATGKLVGDVDPITPGVQTGSVGSHNPVDFDNDGFGDIVFTTSDPEQLIVQFGDGLGGFRLDPVTGRPARVFLDSPMQAEALTVGDFNGDGHMDIAASSSSGGNFSGIVVFLAQFEDRTGDGLTTGEDRDGDKVDDFTGFSSGRYSALPALHQGDPQAPILTSFYFYKRSGVAVNDIAALDYNGDGITDLAITATYYAVSGGAVVPFQVLMFLKADVEDGLPTGQFYADVGTKEIAVPPQGANPFVPFLLLGRGIESKVVATALSADDTHDVAVAAIPGGRSLRVVSNLVPSILGPTVSTISLGQVDSNRALPNGTNQNIALVNAQVDDFTVLDFNNDGNADFAAITFTPLGFVVALQGDGVGGGTVATFNPAAPTQNRGFFFGPESNGAGGLDAGTEQMAIRGGDFDGDGLYDDIAVLDDGSGGAFGAPPRFDIFEMSFEASNSVNFIPDNPGFALGQYYGISGAGEETLDAYDYFYPDLSDLTFINHATIDPELNQNQSTVIYSIGDGSFDFARIWETFVNITTGNGGDALNGIGGAGGSIGTSINPTTLTGSINIDIARGGVTLTAGDGGNGFRAGGAGGSVKGAVVRVNGITFGQSLFAGDGGIGVSGPGGNGGSLIGNSMDFGDTFVAGNGGRGATGGHGGSIIGTGITGLYDTSDLGVSLIAGTGGDGVKTGGNGGNITNFRTALDITVVGGQSGVLSFVAGNGGSAVSGSGGNGGSVTGSSPIKEIRNRFGGDILLQGGNGGDGQRGGNGGSVSNFVNQPDQTDNPAVLSFLGGSGGKGVTGPGGIGGSIINVTSPSIGSPNPVSPPATPYTFNRILAGAGGESSASVGGAGGSIVGVNVTAQDQVVAVVAGAGGAGLTRGGAGGAVTSTVVQIGKSQGFAKALVVAGDGGSASAFRANPLDPTPGQGQKAFGGTVGIGGTGGSITGFTQLGGVGVQVDLIAGNGGDTINYGAITDTAIFVGRGGSIVGANITGTIGNVDTSTPITSYNDIRNGETMAAFINANLRDPLSPGVLTDDVGNVGLVAGAAGRLKGQFLGYSPSNVPIFSSSPAFGGINGSAANITARGIMSAVAGNVERIAALQSVQNIVLTGAGVVGIDKTVEPTPFRDRLGLPTTSPVLDGLLVDGALVSRSVPVNSGGAPINLGPFVYILA